MNSYEKIKKNVDDALKAFNESLDEMYAKIKIILETYKELKESK